MQKRKIKIRCWRAANPLRPHAGCWTGQCQLSKSPELRQFVACQMHCWWVTPLLISIVWALLWHRSGAASASCFSLLLDLAWTEKGTLHLTAKKCSPECAWQRCHNKAFLCALFCSKPTCPSQDDQPTLREGVCAPTGGDTTTWQTRLRFDWGRNGMMTTSPVKHLSHDKTWRTEKIPIVKIPR